ncbi:Cytochrome c, mono-and diheme variants [Marivirga sericea]|uniref:Cytochrome c, mono-and diheme variants n=2 Tax=Marivirga sericea TaxID=1028 RepID=A0A1X7L609_9BACT|nr:Cytochrome c, mono-and diheme variants [Marivirga sericea]
MLNEQINMSLKTYITRLSFIAFLIVSFLSLPNDAFAQADELPTSEEAIANGEKLFKNNCAVCHQVQQKMVGPALKNVYERRELPWLLNFISNSQKVIQSGDEYAVNLYNEYGKAVMPNFDYFADEEIKSILGYIKYQTENPPQEETAAAAGASTEAGTGGGSGIPSEYLTLIIVGFVIVLILILVVLILIVTVLTKFINQKDNVDARDKEYVNQSFNLNKLVRSNGFLFFVILIFTAVVAKTVIDGLYTVGVQQGYQPTQPIAFSHEIHAGQYEIECQYCHTGVMISKSANIPSANICMNCHTAIKTESKEIAKIYKAIDYDPETGEYGDNIKPIEWVRVHNLPDLAYFNHSQHVNVGEIECQTCHGPIEEMAVVKQWSTLTMGWCINCHRETKVNAKGNAYYDQLVEAHDGGDLKVVDIGGLECAKCHY